MNIDLRNGIRLGDANGNRFESAKTPRDLTLDLDLKRFARQAGVGIAQTRHGIVWAHTQAEADAAALAVDATDDLEAARG